MMQDLCMSMNLLKRLYVMFKNMTMLLIDAIKGVVGGGQRGGGGTQLWVAISCDDGRGDMRSGIYPHHP